MRSYEVKLPRGIEVDIFNLPEDFEEQIKESFRGYTAETAKEYRYCDKRTATEIECELVVNGLLEEVEI